MRGITGKAFRTASDAAVSVKELRGRTPVAQVAALDRRHQTHDHAEARQALLDAIDRPPVVGEHRVARGNIVLPLDAVAALVGLADLVTDRTDGESTHLAAVHAAVHQARIERFPTRRFS